MKRECARPLRASTIVEVLVVAVAVAAFAFLGYTIYQSSKEDTGRAFALATGVSSDANSLLAQITGRPAGTTVPGTTVVCLSLCGPSDALVAATSLAQLAPGQARDGVSATPFPGPVPALDITDPAGQESACVSYDEAGKFSAREGSCAQPPLTSPAPSTPASPAVSPTPAGTPIVP